MDPATFLASDSVWRDLIFLKDSQLWKKNNISNFVLLNH